MSQRLGYEECQVDTACREAYHNLTGRLAVLLKELEKEPLATLQAFIEESYPGETGDQMLEMPDSYITRFTALTTS